MNYILVFLLVVPGAFARTDAKTGGKTGAKTPAKQKVVKTVLELLQSQGPLNGGEEANPDTTVGGMTDCNGETPPPSVAKALKQALEFRRTCAPARNNQTQKIVINDYSGEGDQSMYIFDVEGGCVKKTKVSCGNAGGVKSKASPCSEATSKMTPPGFHITSRHVGGARYSEEDSLLLSGLQGQGSGARGILIHGSKSPGRASSWGCSGVADFQEIKSILGYGALVYNYFGDVKADPSCSNSEGLNQGPDRKCQAEAGARSNPDIESPKDSPANAESTPD